MSEPIAENAAITREGPVTAVSVPATIGLGTALVHALDYVVALQVMFDIAAGNKTTPVLVWERLKARGIRSSKNAAELVGRNAVYESFGRLGEAGHLRRVELPNEKHPGRKGPVAYQWFENAAWNPDWQAKQVGTDPLSIDDRHDHASENPQVRMLPRTPEAVSREVEVSAGQNASPNAGSGVQGSGVPGSGGRRIPPGQNASLVPGSGSVSPPHPPGGGGNHHPLPPQRQNAASPRGEVEESATPFTDEQLKAATRFLMELPKPFTVGWKTAERMAPLLLAAIAMCGWELDDDLAAELTKNPEGVKYGARMLAKERIPGLVLRTTAIAQSTPAAPSGEPMCSRHPAFKDGDCSPCRKDERAKREKSEPGPVDGAGLLTRLRAAQPSS